MKVIKTRFKVLIIAMFVLMAILTGGYYYVNIYYPAGDTAKNVLSGQTQGITIRVNEDESIVFSPLDSGGIEKALIFYPGAKVEYTAYAPLMKKLAENGIMCILVRMPANTALLNVSKAETIREKYPEIREWYIGGHSLGGVAAAMDMEKNHSYYKGIVFLGSYPSVSLTGTELRALSICGEHDQVMDRNDYEKCRTNMPRDFREEVIEGGNHAGFGDYGIQKGDGQISISPGEQSTKTAEIIAEWMKSEK